jgi:Raf kinase inhibitor-like YbhB/YbcL family protein
MCGVLKWPTASGLARSLVFAVLATTALLLAGCHRRSVPAVELEGPDSLALLSSSLQGERVPVGFTCDGANRSPALRWNAPPAATRSFALILNDRDAPGGSFVHWVVFNLPPETRSLAEAFPAGDPLPDRTRQGRNDFGETGYGGPCPPGHKPHRYVFMLFALDTSLNLPAGVTRAQVDEAMEGHVLARGTLTASYGR